MIVIIIIVLLIMCIQARSFGTIEQFVVHTNQSVLYSSTGVQSGSVTKNCCVTDIGSIRHYLILQNGLVPNCKANQHISVAAILLKEICVKGTKSLKCRCICNGRIVWLVGMLIRAYLQAWLYRYYFCSCWHYSIGETGRHHNHRLSCLCVVYRFGNGFGI